MKEKKQDQRSGPAWSGNRVRGSGSGKRYPYWYRLKAVKMYLEEADLLSELENLGGVQSEHNLTGAWVHGPKRQAVGGMLPGVRRGRIKAREDAAAASCEEGGLGG